MYFLAGKNVTQFWNIPKEKYFVPLGILYSFIKSLVRPFVNIASSFFDRSFNLLSVSTSFVLFEVIFLFKFFSLSSRSVFKKSLAISCLLSKFACANLASKFSAVNLSNCGVVIYLLW